MKFRSPLIWFSLALASLFLLRFFMYSSPERTVDQYVQEVQRKVNRELAIMDVEQENLKQVLEKDTTHSFADLYIPARHAYFVYQDDSLLAWSDFRFVPEHALLAGDYSEKLLSLPEGKFLTKKLVFTRDTSRIEIYNLLPLYVKFKVENNYLQSGFNTQIISHDNLQISEVATGKKQNIYGPTGTFLFSLNFTADTSAAKHYTEITAFIAGLLGAFLLGFYLNKGLKRLAELRQYEWGFVLLLVYLLALRTLMLYFTLPFSVIEWDLFNPKYYASSETAPSLGDLLLNVLTIATLAIYLIRHYSHSRLYRKLVSLPVYWKTIFSVILVLLSYWILYLHFYVLSTIYLHSQFTLDITQSIDFPAFKILCLIIFLINSSVYFMGIHLLGSMFIRINTNRLRALMLFIIGTICYVTIFYLMDIYYPIILLLNALYFLLLYFFRFPKYLYRFRYITSIYFFVAALVCATIGAYAIFNLEQMKRHDDKERFGAQLLPDNDVFGEFLLDEASHSIQNDPFILNQMQNHLASKDIVVQKVKRAYLSSYFNKYNAEVMVFDEQGRNLDTTSLASRTATASDSTLLGANYFEYRRRFRKTHYRTSYPNLYLVNEVGENIIKRYVHFIDLQRDTLPAGHIVIDLKMKQQDAPLDVYPELLVEKRFLPSQQSGEYSYGIYVGTRLLYSSGDYNYETQMPSSLLRSPQLFKQGVIVNGYNHLGVKGENRRWVVVSSKAYPLEDIIANFSFLFLFLALLVVGFVVTYALRNRTSRTNTNFATKIQLYLNLAFFLPLFVVTVATISIVSVAYRNSLGEAYARRADRIGINLRPFLEKYENGEIDKAGLTREINQIARYSQSDINFFGPDGRLSLTSQPLIYDNGVLSPYINPEAYVRILSSREKEVLLSESVGMLNYKSAYVGMPLRNGELLGIVSIPFFESKTQLDKQIIGVVSTILNIFTAIFIFFLVLSYFASRVLTIPLRLITRKIQKTSLNNYNEPLEWNSDDEIGLLVGEYNRMLVKLEASKTALSQSEKESAWREMAKQVAHEIKNPLTPMKLTLQHMQRALQMENPELRHKTERAFGTLLEQIDNLSDIATSFSAFAKMPTPKNEVFEITSVLKAAADLYANDEQVTVELDIPDEELFVVGDRQLMGGIFTNLIINGIQSVPTSRRPHIRVSLPHPMNAHVTIEVKDNGTGINESIQSKVFLPNFSTKYAGSGIGLALAKRGVEHAGGRIWFDTQEDVGTSFFVELPLAQAWMIKEKSTVGE